MGVIMHVVVLGAGITGLTAAWTLVKHLKGRVRVTLIEKSNRVGGWIRTDRVDGFLFERGPRSVRASGQGGAALKLIEEIGLKDEVLFSSPEAKKRYVWHEGRLECAPSSLWQAFRSPLTKDLVGGFLREGLRKKGSLQDESIYDFIARRYSAELAERLIAPLTACIYAGDIRCLSIRACFPFLKEWEEEHGSILGGAFKQIFKRRSATPRGLISLKQGMESLPKALMNRLDSVVLFQREAVRIYNHGSSIVVELSNGQHIEADHLICTLPAEGVSKLLDLPQMAVPSASVAVVNVGYNSQVLNNKGFGCVFPARARTPVLGVVWDSSAFPEQNSHPDQTRLTLMMGGSYDPAIIEQTDETLAKTALEELKLHLGVDTPPAALSVFRAKHAIPSYPVGHCERVEETRGYLKKTYPKLSVIGTAWEGVAVGACIAQGDRIGQSIVEFAKK